MKRLSLVAIAVLVTGLLSVGGTSLLAVGTLCTLTGGYNVCTDKLDYSPGETVQITGSGFPSYASLTVRVTDPNWGVELTYPTADAGGNFSTSYYVVGLGGTYYVDVFDWSGNLLATHTFTDTNPNASVDFTQCQNDDGPPNPSKNDGVKDPCSWTGGAINQTNSKYTEGDAVPQRLLLKIPNADTYTMRFQYEFSNSSIYAYDFPTTVDLTQSGALLNECGALPGFLDTSSGPDPDNSLSNCNGLFGGGGVFSSTDVPIPSDPFDAVSSRETPASRNFRVGCSPACTGSVTVSFPSLDSAGADPDPGEAHIPDSDPDCFQNCSNSVVQIDVTFTTAGTNTLVGIWFAGHLAQAADPDPGNSPPDGWGTGFGSSGITGAPFHLKTISLIGSSDLTKDISGGAKDNQIQSGGIVPPTTTTTTSSSTSTSTSSSSTSTSSSSTSTSTSSTSTSTSSTSTSTTSTTLSQLPTTTTTVPKPPGPCDPATEEALGKSCPTTTTTTTIPEQLEQLTTTTTTLPQLTTTTTPVVIPAADTWGMTALGLAFLAGIAWLLRVRRSLR